MSLVSETLRDKVAGRANNRCEYCLLPEAYAYYAHEIDHVIAQQHNGPTQSENLAYACYSCNRFKGSNIASRTKRLVLTPLFNPRTQKWPDHFVLKGAVIEPVSDVGEVTARLLRMNDARSVVRRSILQRAGAYPKGD